jgi:site-specific DNA-methyltransferase (adenine-specific)
LKGKKRIHPTEKPQTLYRWLLKTYATEGMKILDTHGGSMNSAIACEIEGFDLDICEIDSEYFQAGLDAFNMHKRQQRLF